MSNKSLQTMEEKAPIEAINKQRLELAMDRMRVVVPDGHRMNKAQLAVIAQESLLTRTMPGKDRHYFLDKKGELKTSDDYKWLVAWAIQRERYLTGNPEASFEEKYQELTEEDKLREGIHADDFAVYCTITTSADRLKFREEVKGWIDMGFDGAKAVELARETLGHVGTRSVGTVGTNEAFYQDGNSKMPTGWSPMQRARIRALKNTIHAKWGTPSIDDMQQMTRNMAQIEISSEDWQDVSLDEPMEVQVRQAEMNAQARQAKEEIANQSPEERQTELNKRVDLMRGPQEDSLIGEDYQPELIDITPSDGDKIIFYSEIKRRIPWYTTDAQIDEAMEDMGILFDPAEVDPIFEQLNDYANEAANALAAA